MEKQVEYGDGSLGKLTATSLTNQFLAVRGQVWQASSREQEVASELDEAKHSLALVEAMAIAAWLGGIDSGNMKTEYGSNDKDRARNILIALETCKDIQVFRDEVSEKKAEHGRAIIELEDAREALKALHSIAWAYGGECVRDSVVSYSAA